MKPPGTIYKHCSPAVMTDPASRLGLTGNAISLRLQQGTPGEIITLQSGVSKSMFSLGWSHD